MMGGRSMVFGKESEQRIRKVSADSVAVRTLSVTMIGLG